MKNIKIHKQNVASIEKGFDHSYASILKVLRGIEKKDHEMCWNIFCNSVNYEEFMNNLYETFIQYFHGIQWYGEKNAEEIQKELLKSAVENTVKFINLEKVSFLYGIKKSYIALAFQNRYKNLLEEIKKIPIEKERPNQKSLRYEWFKSHRQHDNFIMDLIIGYNKDALHEIEKERAYDKPLPAGLFCIDLFQYKNQNKFEGKIDPELLLISIKYCIDHYTGENQQGNPQLFLNNVLLNYNQSANRKANNMGSGISKENTKLIKASILLAQQNGEEFKNGIPKNLKNYLKEVNGNLTEDKLENLINLAYCANLYTPIKNDESDETPSLFEKTGEIDSGFEEIESNIDFQLFIKKLIQDWNSIELLEKKKQREWTKIGLTRDILKILKPLNGIPIEYFQKQMEKKYPWINIYRLLEKNQCSDKASSEADVKDALIAGDFSEREDVLKLFEQLRRPEGNEDKYLLLKPYGKELINNIFFIPYIDAAIDDDIYQDNFDCININNASKNIDNCKLRDTCPLGKPCRRKSLEAIYCNPYRREFDFTYATIASVLKHTETCLGNTESAVKTAFVKYKNIRNELFKMYGLKE